LVKQKESALKNNERDLKIAKMNLMNDIGLDPYAEFRLVIPEDTVYKLPPLEDVVYDALVNSEVIKINHNLVAISKDKIKIAMSRFLPQISLDAGLVGTSVSYLNPQNILFGAITGFLSLFNGFKDVNEYKKAKLQSEAAYIQREEAIMKKELEVEVGSATDTDLLKAMSELEKAESIKLKTEYKYSVSVETLKMLIEK